MRLRFVIDEDYDIVMARQTNKTLDINHMKAQYAERMPDMLAKQKSYQSAWDEINDRFSSYIERATGYRWFYPVYECVLSFINKGISNWGHAPKIVRSYEEDPHKMRRITAHELILSHYFEIFRRHYKDEGLKDGQVWALAEIAAFALTSLTKEVERFWPGDTKYYTNHNYPHIVELQNALKEPFLKSMTKGDFDDYIKNGIKLVREHPEISPNHA